MVLLYEIYECDTFVGVSEYSLPLAEHAYRLLCEKGEQFDDTAGPLEQLADLSYRHPVRGRVALAARRTVLEATNWVHLRDKVLARELRSHGARTASLHNVLRVVHSAFAQPEVVWGVSGFATPGHDSSVEAEALSALYHHLATGGTLPPLVTDGGASVGVLGLNGIIAAQHKVPTLGFTPLQGIASMGVRTHTVVWGDLYRDREVLVGLVPDALACVAGGDGARRECQTTLRYGGVVLLVKLRDYHPESFPAAYESFPDIAEAIANGRFFVCESLEDLPERIAQVRRASEAARLVHRNTRMAVFAHKLSV